MIEGSAKTSSLVESTHTEDILYSSDSECEYKLVFSVKRLSKIKDSNNDVNNGTEPEELQEIKDIEKVEIAYDENEGETVEHNASENGSDNNDQLLPIEFNDLSDNFEIEKNEPTVNTSNDCKYECYICRKFYARKYTLGVHLATIHKQNPEQNYNKIKFENDTNENGSDNAGELLPIEFNDLSVNAEIKNISPSLTTDDDNKYECYICRKFYARKYTLRVHLATIHNQEIANPVPNYNKIRFVPKKIIKPDGTVRFKCHLCNGIYARMYTLRVHMQTIHHNRSESISLPHPVKQMRELPFECYICKKDYVRKYTLGVHLETMHPVENFVSQYKRPKKLHNTDDAKIIKLPTSTFKREKKAHFCEHCNTKFSRASHFEKHLNALRNGKPYFCRICFIGFDTRIDIFQHKRENPMCKTISKPKSLLCSFCGKNFGRKSTLTTHLRTHTNEKPFQCDVCEHKFTSVGAMHQHMNIHSNRKPYICSVEGCRKPFRYLAGLQQHRINVHEPRKLKCPFCNKMFSKKVHVQ